MSKKPFPISIQKPLPKILVMIPCKSSFINSINDNFTGNSYGILHVITNHGAYCSYKATVTLKLPLSKKSNICTGITHRCSNNH